MNKIRKLYIKFKAVLLKNNNVKQYVEIFRNDDEKAKILNDFINSKKMNEY